MASASPDSSRSERLAYIAEMYYLRELTQSEIARRFGVSKMQISRLLREARASGIVEIRVNHPTPLDDEAARALCERFHLQDAVVARAGDANAPEATARAAAHYLSNTLSPNSTLAVAWSSALASTARLMPHRAPQGIRIAQMVGALVLTSRAANPFDSVRRLGECLAADVHPLPAPAFLESAAARGELLAESSIRDTLELARHADVAVVGVGTVGEHSTFYKAGFVNRAEMRELSERGAVCDVLGQFFTVAGERLAWRLSENFVGLSIEELRRIPRVIAIAGGKEKHEAVLGAARAGLLDVLVTDAGTARYLLGASAPLDSRGPARAPRPLARKER